MAAFPESKTADCGVPIKQMLVIAEFAYFKAFEKDVRREAVAIFKLCADTSKVIAARLGLFRFIAQSVGECILNLFLRELSEFCVKCNRHNRLFLCG